MSFFGRNASGVAASKPDKAYRWVKAGAAIESGDLVKWSDATDDPADGMTVVDSVADEPAAGVVVDDIASGAYGLVQCSGYNNFAKTDGNVVEGSILIPGAAVIAHVAAGSADALNAICCVGYGLGADSAGSVATGGIMLFNMI